ncbi:Uncharacterized conserved protein YbjQ, UPF0145 family [Rhizobium sp. 9140]|nr:Uncharacterized conserved protein YbjQ, UPF0145 family [Rhizobium sp. 9140]
MPQCTVCHNDFFLMRGTVCDDCKEAAAKKDLEARAAAMVLATSLEVPNRKTNSIISIVASETALAMNVLQDIANSWRDFVGGRSNTSQNALRQAREACLDQLKLRAAELCADAVIAVNISYSQLSTNGSGGGILCVTASGTAVKLADLADN